MEGNFPSKSKFKYKKNGHARKQKKPQKKKVNSSSAHQSGVNNNVSFGFKKIHARARNIATLIKKGRLSSLPEVQERASTSARTVTEEEKEVMKAVMVKRFNCQTKALDLSNFGNDEEIRRIRCQLFRQPFLAAAADIIAENIPALEALNLNENNLNIIIRLKILSKLTNLKILYLARNKIAMVNALEIFKGLPIVELYLEGNPFVKEYKEHSDYINELKKIFPKLVKLDGKDLGPSINFDLVEPKKDLPSWKKLFLCNPSGQEIVAKFVEQYFGIYDSDNRQYLLDAYHEDAMLSLTATTNQNSTHREILTAYHKVSRNLLHRKMTTETRQNNLRRGKASIVVMLSELPPTKHDPQSMVVDLSFFTSLMIHLTITGIFKETNTNPKAEHVRVFQKTLTIVPKANGGLCIKNELLHINNATSLQTRRAFKTIIIPNPVPMATICQSNQSEEETKLQMIQALCQQTQMNIEWSKKCLEETNFDYNRACFAFNELFKLNKIPQEAFAMQE